MDAEETRAVVERVRRVPDRHRVLDVDAATAARVYRVDAALLSALLDLGLPHRATGGEVLLDALDLENVALGLRLPSPRYLAMRRWPDVLRAAADRTPAAYDVRVSAACAAREDPDHTCDHRVHPRLAELRTDGASHGQHVTVHHEVGPTAGLEHAPPALAELFDEVSDLWFHILPLALYRDLGFVRETGLADCELASLHVAALAADAGWETRRSFGLLLSSPYSAEHFWAEVRLDGVWTAFDPHLVHNLVRWQVLAPGEVSPALVMTPAFLRVAGDWLDLVEDAGRPAALSYLTRRGPLAAAAAGRQGAA